VTHRKLCVSETTYTWSNYLKGKLSHAFIGLWTLTIACCNFPFGWKQLTRGGTHLSLYGDIDLESEVFLLEILDTILSDVNLDGLIYRLKNKKNKPGDGANIFSLYFQKNKLLFFRLNCTFGPLSFQKLRFWPPN